MRRRIIAGNWKMYKTIPETVEFFQQFLPQVSDWTASDIVVFPSFISLPAAVAATYETAVGVGGQDLHWGKEGAYTGEVSAGMLANVGCRWVLIGHSERRMYGGETDADVLKKAQSALEAGLRPMVCLGEKLEDREDNKTEEVLLSQFAGGLAGLTEEQFSRIVVAYEPIWAIGTGRTATPEIAAEAHGLIREEIRRRFGSDAAEQTPILYGGSVKPDNIDGLLQQEQIDGALVGGASLNAASFVKLVRAAA